MFRFKKLRNNRICMLDITGGINNESRKVVNTNYAKYRCNKAKVIKIYDTNTKEEYQEGRSLFKQNFIYKVGETLEIIDYDTNLEEIYTSGISYFITEEAAYWYGHFSDNNYSGVFKHYDHDGLLLAEYNYENKLMEGVQRTWYNENQLSSEYFYVQGKENGYHKNWYKNGVLESVNFFVDGKLEGIQTSYYENGNKKHEAYTKNDILIGLERKWYQNGEIYQERSYINGKLNGIKTEWYNNGQKKFEANYVNGKRKGLFQSWYKNGKLRYKTILGSMVRYKKLDFDYICKLEVSGLNNENKKVVDKDYAQYICNEAKVLDIYHMYTKRKINQGISINNDKKKIYNVGEIVKEDNYDENENFGIHYFMTKKAAYWYHFSFPELYTGEFLSYNEDGILIEKTNYYNGKKHGESKHWYMNGNLNRISNYVLDEKHGNQIVCNEDASIRSEQLYSNGKFVKFLN